jgi:disulfide bond formation protein DsbB
MAIEGKLECSAIGMNILGLSLANWGLINFLIILLFGVLVIFKSVFRSC